MIVWLTVLFIFIATTITVSLVLAFVVFKKGLKGNASFEVDIQDPSIPFYIKEISADFINVNWGDGSEIETFRNLSSNIVQHKYLSKGKYFIVFSSGVNFNRFNISDDSGNNKIIKSPYFNDMSQNSDLIIERQNLSNLDISNNQSIKNLTLNANNLLNKINAKKSISLVNVTIENNFNVNSIDFTGCINLGTENSILINFNQNLESVKIKDCINFGLNNTSIYIFNNKLKSFNIEESGSNFLNFLNLSGNKLTSFSIISPQPNLSFLDLNTNELTFVDIQGTTNNLSTLNLSNNKLPLTVENIIMQKLIDNGPPAFSPADIRMNDGENEPITPTTNPSRYFTLTNSPYNFIFLIN